MEHDRQKEIIDKIKVIIPIKYEIRELMVKVPSQYAGRASGTLRQFGRVLKDNWENDGSLNSTIEIPAGMQEEFEVALNNLTKGQVEIEIIRSK